MRVVRRIYSHLIPEPIREGAWWVRNMVSHAITDTLPVAPTMDYSRYWQWREMRGDTETTHPELVGICAEIIPDGARVLDVGCGSGDFLANLRKRKPVEVVGLDVSGEAVALARKQGIEAYVVDITSEPISIPADFVTIFEVLEHLANPEQVLLGLRALNCPVIASVPNTGFAYARARLLAGRFPRQWIYHPGEHLRYWTLRDFEVMSQYLGYQIEKVVPLKGPPTFSQRWPGLFARYLVFVLRPLSQVSEPGASI